MSRRPIWTWALPTLAYGAFGALFLYPSRRTFLEIVTMPERLGRHEFKAAALDETIFSFPIQLMLSLFEQEPKPR